MHENCLMLSDHRVKVEELMAKSFMLIPPSLISGKWPYVPKKLFSRSLFELPLLSLREKRTDGNTVGYIHEHRTFLLDMFMAFYETLWVCCMAVMFPEARIGFRVSMGAIFPSLASDLLSFMGSHWFNTIFSFYKIWTHNYFFFVLCSIKQNCNI